MAALPLIYVFNILWGNAPLCFLFGHLLVADIFLIGFF